MAHFIALRKLCFHFLSQWIGYDRGDSFPFDFEPNGNPFGSKSNGKLSSRSNTIQFERKSITSFLSVAQEKWCMYNCIFCMHSRGKDEDLFIVYIHSRHKHIGVFVQFWCLDSNELTFQTEFYWYILLYTKVMRNYDSFIIIVNATIIH